jgi:Spy/CpxP family protein refolding chaperone
MSERNQQLAASVLVAIGMLAGTAAPTFADRSPWWSSPSVQQSLQLTTAQIAKLGEIFQSNLPERRLLTREQERLEAQLAAILLDGVSDQETVFRLVDRVVQAHARRNISRTLMLVRMYRVLTPEQRTRLRGGLEQRDRPF